jgi:hypothetical protein
MVNRDKYMVGSDGFMVSRYEYMVNRDTYMISKDEYRLVAVGTWTAEKSTWLVVFRIPVRECARTL